MGAVLATNGRKKFGYGGCSHLRKSSFSAVFNAQVPSGFSLGSRAEARALAPSSPKPFPAAPGAQEAAEISRRSAETLN